MRRTFSKMRYAFASLFLQIRLHVGPEFRIVSGSIQGAGLALNPSFTETTIGTSGQGTGTYSIQVQGAGGQTLYARYFTPEIGRTDTTGTDFQTAPLFSEYISAMAGATAIGIVDPVGNTLTSAAICLGRGPYGIGRGHNKGTI